jgi:phage baseplate assembly protein W
VKDYRFTSLADTVTVTAIEDIGDGTFRVRARGGLSGTLGVDLNEMAAKSYVVVNDREIVVTPPNVLADVDPTSFDIRILTDSFSGGNSATVVFDSTSRLGAVSGIQKLVQQVTRVLLSQPGSNVFLRNDGGGLSSELGGTMHTGDTSDVAAAVNRALRRTEQLFLKTQAKTSLPADEKLLSLKLSRIVLDGTTQTAEVQLVSRAGQSATLPLTV